MTARRRGFVYMLDLVATVPYYTAYLSRALQAAGVPVRIGSITYYLDTACFSSRKLSLDPGCLDVIGRLPALPRAVRRLGKLAETVLNLLVLFVRFTFAPPRILHVQFLPMMRWPLPLDLWLMLFLRRRGVPVVLTVHDLLPHDTGDQFRAPFLRLYRQVDAIICHSEHIRQRLVDEFDVPAARIDVIPHGPFFYDLPASTAASAPGLETLSPDELTVLWQGIVLPYKGLDLLLETWARVEAAGVRATLVVVGTGSAQLLGELRAQAVRLGLKRLHLELRFVSAEELVAFYRRADIVVYPYRNITTSGALATGLSLGKTILASDLPVFRELLLDGRDALLVAPGDPEALAAGLLRLLDEPALRAQLAASVARMQFGEASWASIASLTGSVYRQVAPHREDAASKQARDDAGVL